MIPEINELVKWRNKLNDKLLIISSGDFDSTTKYTVDKIRRQINKISRRITKLEKLELSGCLVIEPDNTIYELQKEQSRTIEDV